MNSNSIIRPCKQCGKEIKTTKARDKKFCSPKCSNQFHNISNPDKKSIFKCKWCGKDFEEWTYRNPSYCSNQCRSEFAARQPKPTTKKPDNFEKRNCYICGKEFQVHKCQLGRSNNSGSCCSRECKGKLRSKMIVGEGNINYRGGTIKGRGKNWSQQAKATRERDCYTCQVCGAMPSKDVHHIRPYRLFGDDYESANSLDNLITLCNSCHTKVEFGKVKLF